jgi:predicted anti-sigma-YlaC factor YlaD
MDCDKLKSFLPDLIFDPARVPSSVRDHLQGCTRCQQEWGSLQATMRLLDEWKAPEPGPYFDVRMAARMREEKEAGPISFWERVRMRLLYGGHLTLRPAMAATLALAVIVGGGSYVGFLNMDRTLGQSPVTSATVQDLQVLDANDQTIQQLNAFDDDGNANITAGGSVTTNE